VLQTGFPEPPSSPLSSPPSVITTPIFSPFWAEDEDSDAGETPAAAPVDTVPDNAAPCDAALSDTPGDAPNIDEMTVDSDGTPAIGVPDLGKPFITP